MSVLYSIIALSPEADTMPPIGEIVSATLFIVNTNPRIHVIQIPSLKKIKIDKTNEKIEASFISLTSKADGVENRIPITLRYNMTKQQMIDALSRIYNVNIGVSNVLVYK